MTRSLEQYISDYLGDSIFTPEEVYELEIGGVCIHVEVFEHDGELCCKEKAHVTLQKDGMTYEFTAVDDHNWENPFYPVTISGTDYLCFRKTLYGFTLLNTETFEDFDFFLEKVLDGKESYIIADAASFENLIVFDGCYWGAPYVFYIYDHQSKRFLDLYETLGLYSHGDLPSASVFENALVLKCENQGFEPVTLTLTYEELTHLLNEKGKSIYNDF